MRKRNIDKHIWFSKAEAQDLQRKAKRACLSEAGLIRLLIKGYEPKEKPDERFYDVMRELSNIGNNINQLAAKANTLGFIDAPQLKKEAEKWNKFQSDVERYFLRPDKSEMKAVTKLWSVTQRLGQVIDYATNPEKTSAKIERHFTPEQYQALADVLAYAKDEEKTEREFYVEGINCNVAIAR